MEQKEVNKEPARTRAERMSSALLLGQCLEDANCCVIETNRCISLSELKGALGFSES